jgi:formylglycine-generating enzyme required for sulfatase activity
MTLRRSRRLLARAAIGAVVVVTSAWPTRAALAQIEGTPQGKPKQAHPGTPKRNPAERTETGFEPLKSTWARFSAREVPKDVKEPTAEELAAKLGLEKVGAGPDGAIRWREPRTSMLFVFVPGGPFPMGANHSDVYDNPLIRESAARGKVDQSYFGSEQPQLSVYVSSFFAGVYEVTNAEYRVFLEAWRGGKVDASCEWPLPHNQPNHVPYLWQRSDVPFWSDRQPVVGITWFDAWAMSRWLGGRLPTEAEWEKAARGTDGRIWPWGSQFDPMRLNSSEGSNRRTTEVGTYPGGRSVFGCYDMAGNVAEFCLDAFEVSSYRFRMPFNPCLVEREPIVDRRVCRGGRWTHFGLCYTTRCTARGQTKMETAYPDPSLVAKDGTLPTDYLSSGFRVVLTPDVDPFPDGAVDRLRAEYAAAAEKLKEARARKAAETGAKQPGRAKPKEGEEDGADDSQTPAPSSGDGHDEKNGGG